MQENITQGSTAVAGVDYLDLDAIDTRAFCEKGARMYIKHPATGEPTKFGIYAKGLDSEAYQAKKHELNQRNIDRLAERAKEGKKTVRTQKEVEEDSIELLAAVVTGWDPMRRGGIDYVFNGEDSARRLLQGWPALREQLDEYVHRRANFLPGSAKT